MKKIINKLNTYFLYTIIFVFLCFLVFFSFIKNGRSFVIGTNMLNISSPQLYTLLIILGIYCAGLSFITYCIYNKKGKFASLVR